MDELKARLGERSALLAALNANFAAPRSISARLSPPTSNLALLKRLLVLCPCLYNQIDVESTAESVVHFCEIALGSRIDSTNVHDAFLVQHPRAPRFTIAPVVPCKDGGTVMEMLCSEVLVNSGIPRMELDDNDWPEWVVPGHMLLNRGKLNSLRALGDILVPCAPTNLAISVKSEAARERLLYSANSVEGIGFGFFTEAREFWTTSRMRLFKRMRFTAIYLPDDTHAKILAKLDTDGTTQYAVNVNGTSLYRLLSSFGADMFRVVGRSSFDL